MLQFSPGESKTAKITMRNPASKAFNYEGVIYMGTNFVEMCRVAFHLDAYESKDISFPVTMPQTEGTYPVYIEVFSSGLSIALYKMDEDITIAVFAPGIADVTGYITDSATGLPVSDVVISIPGCWDVTSRADGFFGLPDLAPGTYQITFTKPYYNTLTLQQSFLAGDNILNVQMERTTPGAIIFYVRLKDWELIPLYPDPNNPDRMGRVDSWGCNYAVWARSGVDGKEKTQQVNAVNAHDIIFPDGTIKHSRLWPNEIAEFHFLLDTAKLGGYPPYTSGIIRTIYSSDHWIWNYTGLPYPYSGRYGLGEPELNEPAWWPEDGATYEWDALQSDTPPKRV